MKQLHKATDRRCYDGCPSPDLQKELDDKAKLFKQIKKAHPSFTCTYFPMEGMYLTFVNHRMLTTNLHADEGDALLEAWGILIARSKL